MLNDLLSGILMILFLAIVVAGVRWLTEVGGSSAGELLFEEENAAEIIALKLS
jgi:hypothetical protein